MQRQNLTLLMKNIPIYLMLATVCWLAPKARAQLTVNTITTTGLNEPTGIAEDADENIYLADSANNRIVRIDGVSRTQSVLAGTGAAGQQDGPGYSANFFNPQGLLLVNLDGTNGLIVADEGNNLIRFVRLSDGYVTTLAGQPGGGPAVDAAGTNATFRYPMGLAQDTAGHVYIADWGNNAVRVMNLNDPAMGITNLTLTGGSLWRPAAVACTGSNQIWIADSGNTSQSDNTIKLFTLTTPTAGSLASFMGGNSIHVAGGFKNSPAGGTNVLFNQPQGLLWVEGTGLLISDTGNHCIRLATNNPVYGPSVYAVTTYAGVPQTPGLQDGSADTARFMQPGSLSLDGDQSYFVCDSGNNALRSIQFGTRNFTPVPTPAIGYITIETDPLSGQPITVFHTDLPKVFYNDPVIAISDSNNVTIHYTYGNTGSTFGDPTISSEPVTPPYIDDGKSSLPQSLISPNSPDLTIKALATSAISTDRRPASSIVYGRFIFQAAPPKNQAANATDPFHISLASETKNAIIRYTLNGTYPDPTNSAAREWTPSTRISSSDFDTNGSVMVWAIASRNGYSPSLPFKETFYQTNAVYDVAISFGFQGGEASSDFIASPGQTFYAPVTLTLRTNASIYSLQFNMTVTNAGINPGPAVSPGQYRFNSFLMKPIPTQPGLYEPIPPLMFAADAGNPPPPGQMVTYDGTNFVNLMYYNTALNLLGVGWLERAGQQNLYNTLQQTLISLSQDHDVMYQSKDGKVIVGGYSFLVPQNAVPNQTYQIQIGRPSATSDGIGAPGSDVPIYAPTNGALHGGAINAIKEVTVGQKKYVVGDVYPFQWFNAGDFGDGGIVNADVEQVFEAAVYHLNAPPTGSDFFDAMDSCGNIGTNVSGVFRNAGSYTSNYPATNILTITNYNYYFGYSNIVDLVNNTTNITLFFSSNHLDSVSHTDYLDTYPGETTFSTNVLEPAWVFTNYAVISNDVVISTYNAPVVSTSIATPKSFNVSNYNLNHLFDANDSTINSMAFGDGTLDVCDVYVTFRRSLDPSLAWFRRFWSGGQRVAEMVPNEVIAQQANVLTAGQSVSLQSKVENVSAVPPGVDFSAGDIVGAPGQTVQVPIKATIHGSYPLRVLLLNLTITPLDGSPAVTNSLQFTPDAELGTPSLTDSKGPGNYAAAWLDSTIAGLTGNVTLGTLTVTLPAGASANAAYAVHFDHASASPNGLATFPEQTLTGLITLSSRTNSTYGDGIPDSWRLRWFGTVNNFLSASNACPSGDGVNNWMKYVAGVDPNTPNDFPSLKAKTSVPNGATSAIHWPSVSGKQYVILRSSSLFSGSWTAISTNTGTGSDMEFDDQSGGAMRFYRVQILP
jgi:hypothetical protein